MKQRYFSGLLFGLLVISMIAAGSMNVSAVIDNPESAFEISLLSPNTNPARNAWSALMAEELPKIGIGVKTHSSAGWDVVGPRTFSHERTGSQHGGVGMIPLYDDGGFDIFFVGLSGDIDYDPTSSYSNAQFSPPSNNFASFDNDEITTLIKQYASELDPAKRSVIAPKIQKIAFEELPYIELIYPSTLTAYDSNWKVTKNELLALGTLNLKDGMKNFAHPTKLDYVYAHSYELTEFSPFVMQSYIAVLYSNGIYPGLYERDLSDANLAYAPMIAKSMPVWNDNFTIATIEVRSDVKFSTGAALTVDDVVNSFKMHLSPAWSVAEYSDLTTYIASNSSISKINNTHMQIKLKSKYFLADELFSVAIFDKDEVGTPDAPLGDGAKNYDFNTNPMKYHGAGPFEYDAIDATAGNVKIKKVANYWNGAVKSNSISFNKYGSKEAALSALQGGDVQMIDSQMVIEPAEVEGLSGVGYTVVSDGSTQMMVVNMDHPILGTGVDTPVGKADPTKAAEAARNIRTAISHAVPRQDIVDTILKGLGTPGTTLWPDIANGYDTTLTPHEYSIAKAQELMELAGYKLKAKKSGLPLVDLIPVALASLFVTAVIVRKRK